MAEYDYTTMADPANAALRPGTARKADRIAWMLALADLSRESGTPISLLLERVRSAACIADADVVTVPEIVSVERNFDLLNTPAAHPSRSESDTFYVSDTCVLRTHMTAMWTWYLRDDHVRDRLRKEGQVTGVSYGKVYRNDEIDRAHYPVFHQIDCISLAKRQAREFSVADLDAVLEQIALTIFARGVEMRITDDTFPFTQPSRQLEVRWNDDWLEVVGAGLVHSSVLSNLGLEPEVYNGWAFGFGLDRLAMRKLEIPDIRILWSTDERVTSQFTSIDKSFVPVSKFPATSRDVSFHLDKTTSLNDFYDIVRACSDESDEQIVEQVELVDRYENSAMFGASRVSYTFRITYRSFLRTLMNAEINKAQESIRRRVEHELGGTLR